ncbi:MAG: hypothetical protein FWC33_05835 [Candidatus Bathyarchaeota archaeon]|nr:hypothetical protein [Candidatus Termiticorpusculum sp.]
MNYRPLTPLYVLFGIRRFNDLSATAYNEPQCHHKPLPTSVLLVKEASIPELVNFVPYVMDLRMF